MNKFSDSSLQRIQTCHKDLQKLFSEVIKNYDCSILCGFRDEAAQNEAFHSGHSKDPWPKSKHNSNPSLAVDVAPYPVDFSDINRFYHFAGFVFCVANQLGISIRWGGDWNSDLKFTNDLFKDLVHFELFEKVVE